MSVIALLLGSYIVVMRLSPVWGILLFFPFLGAGIGFIQARKRTCIALAAQGKCHFDDGVKPIEDPEEIRMLKDLGNAIVYRSIVIAAALTVMSIIILKFL